MVAAIAAGQAHTLTCGVGELSQHRRGDRLLACAFQHGSRAVGIDPRLVADGLEAGDTVLEVRVVQVGDAALDGVVKPLEAEVGFGRPLVQFGDMLATALGALLPPVKNGR